jgi:hypothetical protein
LYDALVQQWLIRERRALLHTTVLANVYRKPGTPAFTPADFLGVSSPAPARRTPEQEAAQIEAWVKAMGGTIGPTGDTIDGAG